MARWWRRIRRRPRHVLAVLALAVVTVAMLVVARGIPQDRYLHELLVNIGAGVAMVIAGYFVFDPLISELQKPETKEYERLDYPAFFRHMETAKDTVGMLETWTGALENRYRSAFRAALATALGNGVPVRILLLDPDSASARQRTIELGGEHDVRQAVMDNLRHLADFRTHLEDAGNLTVRLYSASPSVQMYRWDDKAFISFFPIGRAAYNAKQIESFVDTPLGTFVADRFDELWRDGRELDAFLALEVTVRYEREVIGTDVVRYLCHADTYYVPSVELGEHTTWRDSHRIELVTRYPLSIAGGGRSDVFRLDRIDPADEADLLAEVSTQFELKYGSQEQAIVRLVPAEVARPAGGRSRPEPW